MLTPPKGTPNILGVFAMTFALVGCAGGPMIAEPAVTQSNVHQARQALATHELASSMNLSDSEMLPRLDAVWRSTRPSLVAVCQSVFSHGCHESVSRMRIILIQDNTVNAYADSDAHLIGIHMGLMRAQREQEQRNMEEQVRFAQENRGLCLAMREKYPKCGIIP